MRKFFIIICISLVAGSSAFSQSMSVATINENFVITLPENLPLSDTYQLDISSITFKNQQDCADFFDMMHEIVVNYTVKYDEKLVLISLSYDNRNPGWGIKEWNTYFLNRSQKMQKVYNMSR